MNQRGLSQVIVILIIAGVIALGAGAWFAFGRDSGTETSDSATESSEATSETTETSDDSTFMGSYFDAISRGNPVMCQWRVPEGLAGEFQVGQGEFYTDGVNRGRSSATFENNGAQVTANSIFTEDQIYTWSQLPGGGTHGFKMSRATIDESAEDLSEEEIQQGKEFRAQYSFECQPWEVDEGLLQVPSDIEFMEIPTT